MTAALELAGVSPELLAEIVAHVTAKLSLVPPAPAGLSLLPKSVHRRNCERRQADAVRGDRSGDGLSKIPASVRHREWKRRQAAAKKARIDPLRSPSLDLQPVETEKKNRRSPSDRSETGPLADALAQVVDRVSGYAESNRKRDRVWLYEEARRTWNEDLGLAIPAQWTGPKDWGACRALVREWDRDVLLKAVLDGGRAWKIGPGDWPRPTLGLVLHRLRLDGPAAATTSRPDSRRLTGEQLEVRDLSRARAAKPAPKRSDVSPPKYSLHRADPPNEGTETRTVPSPGTPETASDVSEVCKSPGEALSPVNAPEQRPRGKANTALSSAGPLQLAEPSPSASAAARAALDLVNETAARCRAFRGRP